MNLPINSHNNPLEIAYVNSKKVACDGGKSSLGHPLVYLNMGKNNFVVCPYCSKYFTDKPKSAPTVGIKNQMKD